MIESQCEKLAALRELARHLGLLPFRGKDDAWREQFRLLCVEHPEVLELFIDTIVDGATPVQRSAAALLLDLLIKDWRSVVPLESLSGVVERSSPEYRAWRAAVFERDGHTCRRCRATTSLHAHHIVRWVDAVELRLLVDNGETLCRDCHEKAHGH